jgi:two-component system, NtrC family, response regulator GlrR
MAKRTTNSGIPLGRAPAVPNDARPALDDETGSSAPTREFQPFTTSSKKPDDETLRAPGSGFRLSPLVRRFRLVGTTSFECTTGNCQVGSHQSNDAVIDLPQVSRFHCEVRIDDQRPIVRDLGSTNGTFIDGVRVREGYLKPGSTLGLGHGPGAATLRFELDEKVSAVPLSQASRFGTLVGSSAGMRAAFAVFERAAKSDVTVLLEGETGTGKSRAAEAIHRGGARAERPFFVVDCGALPPTLLEAELFGHEKGAFTGAANRRIGVFEEAKGGTVLLDEIGEVPLELQPRLLRVLEDRVVRRLGQNQWLPVDVRIIAATHRDLREEVNSGRFRSDLYFRLAVVRTTLPALRDRPEDLPEIARTLLTHLGATAANHPGLFSAAFFTQLRAGSWPGNVRELRNYLERCLVFEGPVPMVDDGATVGPTSNALAMDWKLPLTEARKRAVDAFEKQYVEQLVARHQGKVAQAAVDAGVDRVYLYRLMRKHGLKAKD